MDLEAFQKFVAPSRRKDQLLSVNKPNNKNTLIYTRVSTKEQAENNMSLETQVKGCRQFSERHNHIVIEYFGGTYESAQSDERKEFQRMISFAKNYKGGISYILVYSLERFSRNDNAIWLARQLRKLGIQIISVTQPIDTSSSAGILQQSILFLFAQYDNDLRREKSTTGMQEKLLKGYWMGRAPLGYDMVTKDKEQIMTINEKGKLIRQAFVWKDQGIPNIEILKRLRARGLKIYKQKLNWILNNVFYCGLVSHRLLNGKVVEGKHPAIISKELFLKVHNINLKYKHAKHRKEFIDVPLKKFIKCQVCKTPFVGYTVKKKRLNYYKCNKIGCACNRRAEVLHEKFLKLLNRYTIEERFIEPLKKELTRTFFILNKSNLDETELIKIQLSELEKKIEKVEERFVFGDIDRSMYEKFITKLREEKRDISAKLDEVDFDLSNLPRFIEVAVKLAANLRDLWASDHYELKLEVQNFLFPKGIYYDKQIDDYRTDEVNIVLKLICELSKDCGEVKKGLQHKNVLQSNSVGPVGIEPTTHRL